MRSEAFARFVARLYDAALAPELWPTVLRSLADAVGTLGAGYLVTHKQTGRIEWLSLAGFGLGARANYLGYYAARDPYRPLLEAAPVGEWQRLSWCVPESRLRRDEWYTGYLARLGVGDMLGARLFDNASHTGLVVLHEAIGQPPLFGKGLALLRELLEPLSKAARLHAELGNSRWTSAVARRALECLTLGVILVDGDARVIEMNAAAEAIVARNDGLALREGRLAAQRAFEECKLARLAAGAVSAQPEAAAGRMLIARRTGQPAYALTALPLGSDLARGGDAHALILVADPERSALAPAELTELFGLSPAEGRLAASLQTGKRLCDIAADSGVRITTLRTQLSAILAKVGVERQADLVRVLSGLALAAGQPWAG
jgi:PAS domain-containing protein/DNA-binding CsgD family transcriptional regulator